MCVCARLLVPLGVCTYVRTGLTDLLGGAREVRLEGKTKKGRLTGLNTWLGV